MSFDPRGSRVVHIRIAVDRLLLEPRTLRGAVARFVLGIVRVDFDHLRKVDLVHS